MSQITCKNANRKDILRVVIQGNCQDTNVKIAAANLLTQRGGGPSCPEVICHSSLRLLRVSMGNIARFYKVSMVAVLKWIKAAALEAKPINPVSESDIVMIEEVWHFVSGKKQNMDLEGWWGIA